MTTPRTIAGYLDALLFELRTRDPGVARRVLGEAEDHLREAVAARLAAGEPPDIAEEAAIAAFGEPHALARAYPAAVVTPEPEPVPLAALARQFTLFAGLVLTTVGISGLLLLAMGEVGGTGFAVSQPVVNVTAYCMSHDPAPVGVAGETGVRPECLPLDLDRLTRTDRQHALLEAVTLRVGLGLAGIACFAILRLYPHWGRSAPAGLALAAPFAAAAVALPLVGASFYLGMDRDAKSVDGAGWYYSAGIASLLLLVAAAARIARSVRAGRTTNPTA
ncbi:MAG: hypothetical protein IT302_15635 [Dehalococcoidia bacterium]|nr:hypothetical protein [Dehalococcoidia bacterium]